MLALPTVQVCAMAGSGGLAAALRVLSVFATDHALSRESPGAQIGARRAQSASFRSNTLSLALLTAGRAPFVQGGADEGETPRAIEFFDLKVRNRSRLAWVATGMMGYGMLMAFVVNLRRCTFSSMATSIVSRAITNAV